jgi:hypothetical protein
MWVPSISDEKKNGIFQVSGGDYLENYAAQMFN